MKYDKRKKVSLKEIFETDIREKKYLKCEIKCLKFYKRNERMENLSSINIYIKLIEIKKKIK